MALRKYRGKKIEVAINCSKAHNGKKGKIIEVDVGDDKNITDDNKIKIDTGKGCIQIRIAGLQNSLNVVEELKRKEFID